MFDDDILACLQRIEARLNSDEYEYGGFFAVGGNVPVQPLQNNYIIKSPWNTECEWCLFSCCANTNRLTLAVSSKNPAILIPDMTGTVQYGDTALGSESNAVQAIFAIQAGNGGQNFHPIWNPLEGSGSIYIAMGSNVGATAAYATFAFRRKLNRAIPTPPRRDAHTHTHVGSRRGERTFAAGFAAQYPRDKYIHEEIPESQDTAAIGNVTNVSPAQSLLAKLRNGGR